MFNLQTSLTAAHCAKTLITAASVHVTPGDITVPGALLRATQCARTLLPPLIEFVAKVAPKAGDGSSLPEGQLVALGEVWKTFSVLIAGLIQDDQRLFSHPSYY